MPDPFEALREPAHPVAPDPLFAAHLRARLVRALALPKGVTVSNLDLDIEPAATPVVSQPVIPYLIVVDARQALDWYADAMGARLLGEPLVMSDGRVGHAEFEIGGGTIYLADESPESHVAAPRAGDAATVSLTLSVADVDALAERAAGAGAVIERPPADYPHGRNAVVRDPFGHRWIVSAAAQPSPGALARSAGPGTTERTPAGQEEAKHAAHGTLASAALRMGDVAYVSLWVPDVERAAAFFSAVLGWRYGAPSSGLSRQVEGQSLRHGLFGGRERRTLFLCFAVDDVGAAVDRVRAAGGAADEPSDEPYGRTANCIDNQGVAFAVFELPPDDVGARAGGPRISGERHGDISYLTMEVQDSGKARAFYGSVLGWRFSPGRVDDGWGVIDVVPMTGMHGGHAQATTLPMYRVDDIYAAVERVRALGGTSPDPQRQSYGLSAECADDQGSRFYLGQH